VAVADHDLGDVSRVDAEQLELIGQGRRVLGAVILK
jgi:hypothetical protein